MRPFRLFDVGKVEQPQMEPGSKDLFVWLLFDIGRKVSLIQSLLADLDEITVEKGLVLRNIFGRIA